MSEPSIILSGPQYLALDRPDLYFIVNQAIPKPGIVILAGEPKIGKSFLALQLAKHVAEGIEWGDKSTKASRVLYLVLEAEMVWYDRVRKLDQMGFRLPPTLFFPHPEFKPNWTNLAEPRTQDWLRRVVRESNPDLVILDPLREIHSADEQDSTQMKIVGDCLTDIFAGRALLVVHHMKKIAAEVEAPDPIQSVRGSSYITGKADAIWLLHGNTLRMVPRFALRESKSVLQDSVTGLWHFVNGHVPQGELPGDV